MKHGEILEQVRTSLVVMVVMVAAVIAWLVVGSSRKASEVRAAPAANAAYRPAHGSNSQSGAEDPKLSFSTSIEVHATVQQGALTGVRTGTAVVSEVPLNFDGYLTPGRRP